MKKLPAKLSQWMCSKIKKSETQKAFFERVVEDEKLSQSFVDFVTKNPRLNKTIYRALSTIITSSEWRTWQKKYGSAYAHFMYKKWAKAKKIEDVLRIIPNFSPWALKDRFDVIRLGKVPVEFGKEEDYFQFLKKIRSSKVIRDYKRLKSLENNLKEFALVYPEVKKINWFNMTDRTHFLSRLMHQITDRPFTIRNANHQYKVQFLCNPFSCKMVFDIQNENNQKFILKMLLNPVQKILSDDDRKISENQAIRPDSPYTNALIEFYLKLNKCSHVCDIQYYTSEYEAVLYKKTSGTLLGKPEQVGDFYDFNNKQLKDMNRLGIYVNDMSLANFMLTPQKVIKVIDIGHASFANPLTQGLLGLTFTFGNLSGQDYLHHFGVMSMED